MVPRPLNEGDIPPGYFPLDLNARQRLAVARIRMGDTEEGKVRLDSQLFDHVYAVLVLADISTSRLVLPLPTSTLPPTIFRLPFKIEAALPALTHSRFSASRQCRPGRGAYRLRSSLRRDRGRILRKGALGGGQRRLRGAGR